MRGPDSIRPQDSLVPYQPGSLEPVQPRGVCPTCLRPFDDEEPTAHSPGYFRKLDRAAALRFTSPTPEEAESIGYYEKYFVELRRLGRGSFGSVFVCRHIVEGNDLGLFAVKKLPVGNDAELLRSVLREVKVLEEVRRHPNVIEYNHSWIDFAQLADFGPSVRCLFILMEYASEGSLDVFLQQRPSPLSDAAVWYFFFSAVCGVAYIHSKGILHRDIKPQNLLLTENSPKPPRLMVADFGTSVLAEAQDQRPRTGGTGTEGFMAPELLVTGQGVDGAAHFAFLHTKASDVWSLGAVLYYLAFDQTPPSFEADMVLRLPPGHSRPRVMTGLLRAMLSRDPTKRPSCEEILSAPPVKAVLAAFEDGNWKLAEGLIESLELRFDEVTAMVSPPAPLLIEGCPKRLERIPSTSRIHPKQDPEPQSLSSPQRSPEARGETATIPFVRYVIHFLLNGQIAVRWVCALAMILCALILSAR